MQFFLFAVMTIVFWAAMPVQRAHADQLLTGPVPNWAEVLDIPTATPALRDAAAQTGVLLLLADEQVRWSGDEKQTYLRAATLITDQTGLEQAATLTFNYAPDYENLILTRVAVLRGDQVIDLTETVQADILPPGTPQAAGVPDGNLTAVVQVPDLRVGDVIDYSYTRRTLAVIAGATRSGKAVLEFDVPAVLSRVVVDWPAEWPIYISGWPARVSFTQTPGDGVVRHVWTRADHRPGPAEPATPAGYSANVVIDYSAFPDWSAIAGAASPHYLGSYPLGAAWDEKLRAIQAAHPDTESRVIAAVRAVQDDLRYVRQSIGAGGLLARLPEEVTRTGYGDSKDKALLLRTMLDKMGIEAYVALTDRDDGHALAGRKPAVLAFDHAIVKVVVGDLPYWMDATASHERGDLYTSVVPDFGYALPLTGADQQQLDVLDQPYASIWSVNVDEAYDFTLLGAYVTVTTTHFGPAANALRNRLANAPPNAPPDAQPAAPQSDFQARHPGMRLLATRDVIDDPVANSLTQEERYLIPVTALTGDVAASFEFAADDYTAGLPRAGQAPRLADLDLGLLRVLYHRVSVTGAAIDFTMPAAVSAYNDGFGYSFSGYAPAHGEMILEWSFSQTARQVTAAQAEQVMRDAAIVSESRRFSWDLRP